MFSSIYVFDSNNCCIASTICFPCCAAVFVSAASSTQSSHRLTRVMSVLCRFGLCCCCCCCCWGEISMILSLTHGEGGKKKIPYLQILIQWCFLHAPLLLCTFLVSCLLLYLIQHPHLKPPWHGHGDGRDTACAWDNHCQSRAAGEPRKHLIGKDSLWIRIIELDLYQRSTTCRDRSGQL